MGTTDAPSGLPTASASSTGHTTSANNCTRSTRTVAGKPERPTTSDQLQTPSSWSSANVIAFLERPGLGGGSTGIWVLPSDGDRKPRLFLESRFNLTYPEFSPDGHWMHVSNESGGDRSVCTALPWSRREDPDLDGRRNRAGLDRDRPRTPLPRQHRFGPGFFSAAIRPVSVPARHASPAVRDQTP